MEHKQIVNIRPMDDDLYIPLPGLICPQCSVVVFCEYSKSYLRDKALVDCEVEVTHHDPVTKEFHMNTVKLTPGQLDRIRTLLKSDS